MVHLYIHSYIHMYSKYVYIFFFFIFFSIMVYLRILNIVPFTIVAPCLFVLDVKFTSANTKLLGHPAPTLISTSLFCFCELLLFCKYVHLYHILDYTYFRLCYHMVFVFLFLTYLTWCGNLCLHHVAAVGFISFFFMPE